MEQWLVFLLLGRERLLICFPVMGSCHGICKVLIAIWKARSWMSKIIRCYMYASTYACVHKTILPCKQSFCWHMLFSGYTTVADHTHLNCSLAYADCGNECVQWGWRTLGKIHKIFIPSRPSVFCCCSLDLLFYSWLFSLAHLFMLKFLIFSGYCFMISTPSYVTFFSWQF